MSNYTMELNKVEKYFKVFNFEYDFYIDNEDIKGKFEEKFIDEYFFHEIGSETVFKFQHRLKTKLNKIMPYYKQLYQTELRSNDIDFMLNKDLVETFERELQGNTSNDLDNKSISNALNQLIQIEKDTTELDEETVNTISNDYKESNIENGNASLELDNGSLTNVNKSVNENNNKLNSSISNDKNISSDLNNTTNVQNTTTSTGVSNQREVTNLISKGNIGITSSAELLEKWRKVLINIDELIINECSDLFMMVY